MAEGIVSDEEDLEAMPGLPEAVVAHRNLAKDHRETVIVDGVHMAFTTPDVENRKFVWVHVPFNNPTWVKVSFVFFFSPAFIGYTIYMEIFT